MRLGVLVVGVWYVVIERGGGDCCVCVVGSGFGVVGLGFVGVD